MIFLPGTKTIRALALILRLALGAVFIYAAWTKLRDPWAVFAVAIDSFQSCRSGRWSGWRGRYHGSSWRLVF